MLSAVGLFILIRSFIEAFAVFDLWFFDFSLSCLDFSYARPREGGGAAERPRECSYPSRPKGSRPGPIIGAPLQSVPHGHRDTNTGPGSVAPHGWGRELPMRRHIAGRHDNGSKATINSNNPNMPPRGSTLPSFYAGKRKRKNKFGAARLTPARGEGPSCLRSSGGLPLALHQGATVGGRATTPKQIRLRGGWLRPPLGESPPEEEPEKLEEP